MRSAGNKLFFGMLWALLLHFYWQEIHSSLLPSHHMLLHTGVRLIICVHFFKPFKPLWAIGLLRLLGCFEAFWAFFEEFGPFEVLRPIEAFRPIESVRPTEAF